MHPHDAKWISEQLELLPDSMRAKVRDKYQAVYADVIARNEGSVRAEGFARREANTRLLECVERFGSAYHGKVVQPRMR